MAITKEKKKEILAALDEIKTNAASVVFVQFQGLTGANVTAMRTRLRQEGVGYFVAKKTLLTHSFQEAFSGQMPPLEGEVAVAYSTDDPIVPAQKIKECAGTYPEQLSIAGGVFEGVYKTKEEMTEIASIPPLTTLRGMFVNVINSPLQGLAVALEQIAQKRAAS